MPEDQRIARNTRSENVLIEQSSLLVVARVVKARAVGRKRQADVACGRQLVFKGFAGDHVQYMQARVVRAAFLDRVNQQLSVARHILNCLLYTSPSPRDR